MAAREYAPEAGDLVWLSFDPQSGREQKGRRPALVISPQLYNARVGLAVICPITTQVKGYPFEVGLPAGGTIQGPVLADHLKNLDWRAREAKFAGRVPAVVLNSVRERLRPLLGL